MPKIFLRHHCRTCHAFLGELESPLPAPLLIRCRDCGDVWEFSTIEGAVPYLVERYAYVMRDDTFPGRRG